MANFAGEKKSLGKSKKLISTGIFFLVTEDGVSM